MMRPPPRSTLFPYTTLFRSVTKNTTAAPHGSYLFIPLGNLLVHVGTERRVAAHLLVQGRVLLTQALFQRIGLVIDPVLGLAVALLELLQALALGVEGAIEFQRLAREILHARGQALRIGLPVRTHRGKHLAHGLGVLQRCVQLGLVAGRRDRKSTRLNSSHLV